MKKILIVVDMQNDFIDGALGHIIWKHRRGKTFRLSIVSVIPKAGRSEKSWMH